MKNLGKILVLSSLLLTGLAVAPIIANHSNVNGVNEQALDFGANNSGINFVHNQVLGTDSTVEVSRTFVQYGVTTYEGSQINVLRFATAVKGEIETLSYTRDHIEGLNDSTVDVSTVYRSLSANGKSIYFDPAASSNGLTADESYAGNYYWACYLVRFVTGDTYKDTDFTVRLNVNGEEKASVTRSLQEVMSTTSTCSHNLTYTPAKPATKHVNGTLGYYTCTDCGFVFEDADAVVHTTVKDRTDVSEGWTTFVPGFGTTNSAFTTEETTLNGIPANRVTIAAGTTAGTTGNLTPSNTSTYNTRTNLVRNVDTKFSMTIKNESNFAVDFRYFFDNYGDKGGHDMHLEANETKTFDFVVNFDTSTPGPWHGITVKNDLAEEAKLVITGEYTTNGTVDGEDVIITKYHDANKVKFAVGDVFTSEGLKVKLVGGVNNEYDWARVESYETNLDGHTFTLEDVGTKTVLVQFGGSSFTYDIEVAPPHTHVMAHTAPKAATYNMDGTLGYYTCTECGVVYEDENGNVETTVANRVAHSDGWFKFAPKNEVSTSASGVTSVYETIDEKVFKDGSTYATRVSFNNDVNANTEINFCTGNSTQYGVNNRVPMHSGKQLDVKLFVKNHSSNSLAFDYRLNDNDGNSAVRVELAAGEEKVIETTLSLRASTPGGWNRMIPVENIPAGSSFSVYGYIKTRGYQEYDGTTNTIAILKEATQKAFIVGEKFNSNGMIVKHNEAQYETYVNAGTNFDGHTFTQSDIGTHTVEVRFGSSVTTYQIEVTKGHELQYVQGSASTWANGTNSHYECTICHKLFSDENGQNEITLDDVKVSKGAWARVTNKKQTFNNSNVGAEYVNVNDTIFPEAGVVKATKVTFLNGIANGATWDHPNNWDDGIALNDGVSNRMPLIPGKSVDYKFYLKNTGESTISIRYQFWNDNNSTVAFTVTLAPGEETIIDDTFNVPSNVENSGGWARFTATGDIAQGAEFISYWYYSTTNHNYMNFNTTGNKDSVSLQKKVDAKKLTFKVGETFTAEGLALKLNTSCNGGPDGGNIFNFTTNYDNHVFTSADIGTQTVTVRFADASITYNIVVEA